MALSSRHIALIGLVAATFSCAVAEEANYLIGRGMYDMTGPAGEINFMGYAKDTQTGKGIHLRQYSRAFIITDRATQKTMVFVSIDACMASQVITLKVLERLKELYGDKYNKDNVIISGTHTHSAPAGFFQYVLFDITSLGVSKLSITAYVNGVIQSIQIAHGNMQPGYIMMNSGLLLNASRNRSPTSYLQNPEEERKQYEHDTDKLMTVLKVMDASGKGLGMINWFAVHCTSMNNSNTLISSDNKGYASLLFEEMMNPGAFPGEGDFVAAFAQSNLGDVSPNTRGAHCTDSGLPCESNHSTCHGRTEKCVATGPGKDMFDSTRIIATLQFKKAKELYDTANIKIEGPIDFRQSYIDMSKQTVKLPDGSTGKTCKPAMGYSFAAGTTDGPGDFDFTQGTVKGNPFWNAISHLIVKPTKEQAACHYPKPILVDTGEIHEPFDWQPTVVGLSMVRLGQLLIVAVPGEFTTMAGRRLRKAIHQRVVSLGWSENTTVVIAGLSFSYGDYITTFEEYQAQRYEAASTIFGPHTLRAYIDNYVRMAEDLVKGNPSASIPSPTVNEHVINTWDYPFPVIADGGFGTHVGHLTKDVKPIYKPGDVVSATFYAGNPRNNLMTNQTFLTVEMETSPGKWQVFLKDSSWHTEFHWNKEANETSKFHWDKNSKLSSISHATIIWRTQADTIPGTYRLRHFGYYSPWFKHGPRPYNGTSSPFKIVA